MKTIYKSLIILICIILQSCASSDYALNAQKSIISDKNANQDESNVGLNFGEQILYSPVYLFNGLVSQMTFLDSQKNQLKKSMTDFDYEVTLNEKFSPSLLIIPQCYNKILFLTVGFIGEENKLVVKRHEDIVSNYEIKKDDIYLKIKDSGNIVSPNIIYLAGTKFETITSRPIEVSYPILHNRKTSYRLVKFDCYCQDFEEDNIDLVISKIYKNNKIFKENIILSNYSLNSPRLTPAGTNGSIINIEK